VAEIWLKSFADFTDENVCAVKFKKSDYPEIAEIECL
jgi:hypothetical protein